MLTLIGSFLGLAGSFIPKLFTLFEQRQQHAQELDRMRLSAELADQQHRMDLTLMNAKADIAQQHALYQHDASFHQASPWVDNMRAMVRPILTFGSLILYGGLLCFADAGMLASSAFAGLEAMCATVWTFWFGNRAFNKT